MSKQVDKNRFYKTVEKTCLSANITYLFLHLLYLTLFFINKYYILVAVTSVVVLFYLLAFPLILKLRKYYLYALICGNVFLVFVSVTTTTVWVGLSLIIYLTLYFVTKFNKPYYVVPEWLEITLFTINAVMVFIFILIYLTVFIRYALSLEDKIINESRTDELTQINNRYALYDFFDRDENHEQQALVLFDIDDFKNVNDVYGHVAGENYHRKTNIQSSRCRSQSDYYRRSSYLSKRYGLKEMGRRSR